MDKDYSSYAAQDINILAAKNDLNALYELGIRYLNGKDFEKNLDNAKKYLVFAMLLGHEAACRRLGNLYIAEGDVEKGVQCYKVGMRRGDMESAYLYALQILEKNESEAVNVLMEAYESGSEKSGRLLKQMKLI